MLASLAVVAALVLAFVIALRRKRKSAVRFSSLSLVRAALPKYSKLRRFLPPALFALALTSLGFALARPVAIVDVPSNQTTIMLAIDVSRSMCATDISPNRLVAAENAAIAFVEAQDPNVQIGVVAFSGFAEVVQMPTRDRAVLRSAIEGLSTGRRTAIGSGIVRSLEALAQVDPSIAPPADEGEPPVELQPLPKGAYAPHIVILLTDGASNYGIDPVEAAEQSIARGVRVFTIGFGTAQGSELPPCGAQLLGREPSNQQSGSGGNFAIRGRFRRGIDEETLKKVAALTDAEYFSAESSAELNNVFKNVPTNIIMRSEVTEISFIFVALGALLALAGIVLAWWWQPLL
jgi:Ca-activated chloride channel family protein